VISGLGGHLAARQSPVCPRDTGTSTDTSPDRQVQAQAALQLRRPAL